MGAPLLLFVGCIYAVVAWEYASKGKPGMALAFAAYALSNLGFAWDLTR